MSQQDDLFKIPMSDTSLAYLAIGAVFLVDFILFGGIALIVHDGNSPIFAVMFVFLILSFLLPIPFTYWWHRNSATYKQFRVSIQTFVAHTHGMALVEEQLLPLSIRNERYYVLRSVFTKAIHRNPGRHSFGDMDVYMSLPVTLMLPQMIAGTEHRVAGSYFLYIDPMLKQAAILPMNGKKPTLP